MTEEQRNRRSAATRRWKARNPEHGPAALRKWRAENPERSALYDAKARCTNPKHPDWKWYGGAGVRFSLSVEQLLAEIGPRPKGKTLDRIDPHGHYEPGNVRWATPRQQRANQRMRPKTWRGDPVMSPEERRLRRNESSRKSKENAQRRRRK